MERILFFGLLFLRLCFSKGDKLRIDTASDWGYTVSGYPASNAIDASIAWSSRWVASTAKVNAVNLVLDMGSDNDVAAVGISWGHGDDYKHTFEIRALPDGGSSKDWILVYTGSSSGTTEQIETYDITAVEARYIRVKVFSNTEGDDQQMIKEVELYDNGSSPVASPTDAPIFSPTNSPTSPRFSSTSAPTSIPTPIPTESPTVLPTAIPTAGSELIPGSTTLPIETASDWGYTVSGFPASNAIDGSLSWASRWVASTASVDAVNLVLDMASNNDVTHVGIAWGHGDDYSYTFEIRASPDGGDSSDWLLVYSGTSSGTTESIETYDITDVEARYIRIKIFSNSDGSDEQMIKEVELYNYGSSPVSTPTSAPVSSPVSVPTSKTTNEGYNLDPNVPPCDNFDLLGWYLSIPVPDDDDGYATNIYEKDLVDDYESEFFYTGSDGAMVFWTPCDGVTTSSSTKYFRTELRGMLRRGDTSLGDTKADANNWAFSSVDQSEWSRFGGIDGELSATLAVHHVTTTGTTSKKNGRIVIAQIHAAYNEPIRLYYHKVPGNSKGSVYFVHEKALSIGGGEVFYNLLGEMVDPAGDVDTTSNPSNGIELDEVFSYNIVVVGDSLEVTISQDGTVLAYKYVDMSSSGYDDPDQYMYFKAGIYLLDNTCDEDDYGLVSFYELTYSHN